uniref:Ribonuclease P protein subunit p29 n=1 Tax=Caenorhabditis japonica TaxID=281687 RepID=A0A8R1HQW6_CAEJA
MNTDWQKYFRDRLGPHFASQKIEKTILKADYHGALLTVWVAENPTQIGISGIVILETRHTFQMVTQDDRFVVIPKKGAVFRFILGDRLFSLFGDGMRTRPAWRGKKPRVKRVLPTFIRGTLQPVPTACAQI